MVALAAALSLFIIIPYGYLEYKLATKKSSTVFHLAKGICLELPPKCVHKMNKTGLTLYCKNGDSAHIRSLLNTKAASKDKNIPSSIPYLSIMEKEGPTNETQLTHIISSENTPTSFEFKAYQKGGQSFLLRQLKECSLLKNPPQYLDFQG